MSRSKPLAYQSSKSVLEYLSFGKRKHFYAMCPAIRKMEEILPYHLELVSLKSAPLYTMTREVLIMTIDSFGFYFWENEGNEIRMTNDSTGKSVYRLTSLGPEQAAEKFLLYNLSRNGTRIKNVELTTGPEFISKCIPIAIKNLDVKRTTAWFPTNIPIENVKVDTTLRGDTLKMAKHVTVRIPGPFESRINTEIISEWNCDSIQIESSIYFTEVADYCNKVSKRIDRPIGSSLKARNCSPLQLVLSLIYSKMNGRRTMLNDRPCGQFQSTSRQN